jgi:hypothetical protein
MTPSPSIVQTGASLRSLRTGDAGARVWTTFRYDPADPYAVHILFHTGEADDNSWAMGRDLLFAALTGPAGYGDVRLWPYTDVRGGEYLALALSSPDGGGLLEIPRHVITRFLGRTYRAVPSGDEPEYLDLDGTVAALLAEDAR